MGDTKQPEKQPPLLSRKHFEDLATGSGISTDIINTRKYRTITEPKELRDLGFNRQQSQQVPGLLIPVSCTDGSNGFAVYRPDIPRTFENRRKRNSDGTFHTDVIKYEMPPGMGMRLDCPAVCRRLLADPALPLWITEGQKKADALASRGLCAIALLGVWNFKGKNQYGGITFLADFDYIALNGRDVRIVFDSDVMTKTGVRAALDRFTEHLQRKQAHVAAVHLPMLDGAKVGVDDFLLTHSIEDLEGLIEAPRLIVKAAAPIVRFLKSEPPTIRRPLALIGDHAYAAVWPWVEVEVAEEINEDGVRVRFEKPRIDDEGQRPIVVRDDGKLFNAGEDEIEGLEPLTGIRFQMNSVPGEERHRWSTDGFNAFCFHGYRAEPLSVFNRIADVIDYHMDFDKSLTDQRRMSELVACYTLATWFLDAFHVIGYLWSNGQFGSGKSELLHAVAQMSFFGEVILAQSTIATVRDAADFGGTLGFDDVEKLQRDKTKADLVAILLAGNRRGATMQAKEGLPGGGWVNRRFNCFCPRIFSSSRTPEGALQQRSIMIPLIRSVDPRRKGRTVTAVERWPHDQRQLIDDLWALSLSNLKSMRRYDEQVGTRAELQGRPLEPWRSILAIAAWLDDQGVSGLWNRMHALSLTYQKENSDLDPANLTRLVIRAIDDLLTEREVVRFREVFGEGDGFFIKTKDITDAVKEIVTKEDCPVDLDYINSKRIGWILLQLRFKHGREGGTGKAGYYFTRIEVERHKFAYGLPSPEKTSQNLTTSQAATDDREVYEL